MKWLMPFEFQCIVTGKMVHSFKIRLRTFQWMFWSSANLSPLYLISLKQHNSPCPDSSVVKANRTYKFMGKNGSNSAVVKFQQPLCPTPMTEKHKSNTILALIAIKQNYCYKGYEYISLSFTDEQVKKMTMKIEQEQVMKWILNFFEAKKRVCITILPFLPFMCEHKWIYRKLIQIPPGLIPFFICQPPIQTNTQRLYWMLSLRKLLPQL